MSVDLNIAVCYCLIDNFDDIVESTNNASTNVLFALVEQQLNNFSRSLNGMFKKLEKDRFLLIINTKHIETIKSRKFELLNSIKKLNSTSSVTLSIGLCYGKGEINELNEGARSALDLALGRGGDQIVIKRDSEYEFFGDASIDKIQNSKVKSRVKSAIFTELAKETDETIIMGHSHPDLDCVAAAIGTYRIVKTVNPYCNCKIAVDTSSSSISKLLEKLFQYDEYKDVFINNEDALAFAKKDTLLVVVDVFRPTATECPKLFDICESVIVFDHHRKSTDFIKNPVLAYHDAGASSTSELITEMLIYLKDKPQFLDIEIDALLAGITVDTKNFVFKTSFKTFETAAFLKKNGASSHNVHKFLQNDIELYKIKSDAVNSAFFYKDIVAMTTIVCDIENPILVAAQTADELLNLNNIKASFVFFEINDTIYISSRSLGEINVQLIMESFGGGGHRTIAAAQVTNLTVDDIISIVKKHIDNIIDK